MNELFNGIVIVIISAVVGGSIGYYFKKRQIKNEYDRKLINERTNDFLKDLRKYYMPLGYYSALLAQSSGVLSSKLAQKEIDEFSIKKMLFDLGNYLHIFLDLSEKRGYPTFPNYKQKYEIMEYHLGILIALDELITDQMAYYTLRKISKDCKNDFKIFYDEIDKTEIPKKFRENLTKDSYLFNWNEVPGKHSEKFIMFLKCLNIHLAENTNIQKSNGGKEKAIFIKEKKHIVILTVDEENKKAVLKIGDAIPLNLKVKKENDQLNIYEVPVYNIVRYGTSMYRMIEKAIDSALEPWYKLSKESRKAYKKREQYRKELEEALTAY